MDKRANFVSVAEGWLGCKESDGSHKKIIDCYNNHKPLPRGYNVRYTDAWCATYVSAVAIMAGVSDIVPLECSCYYLIEKAKKMGIWVENDGYIPSYGDICLYDWQDNGKGDNKGTPDHVGIVTNCDGKLFYVVEGNKNNKVDYRRMNVDGKYIRGFIVPKFDSGKKNETALEHNWDIDQLAKDVIKGKYGNGKKRKEKLESMQIGLYTKVQKRVNELLKKK